MIAEKTGPQYLRPKRIAELYDVTRQTVVNWIRFGVTVGGRTVRLLAERAGRHWRVRPEDLEAFLSATTGRTVETPDGQERRRREQEAATARLDARLGKRRA